MNEVFDYGLVVDLCCNHQGCTSFEARSVDIGIKLIH
jgi:hypothetical protein